MAGTGAKPGTRGQQPWLSDPDVFARARRSYEMVELNGGRPTEVAAKLGVSVDTVMLDRKRWRSYLLKREGDKTERKRAQIRASLVQTRTRALADGDYPAAVRADEAIMRLDGSEAPKRTDVTSGGRALAAVVYLPAKDDVEPADPGEGQAGTD